MTIEPSTLPQLLSRSATAWPRNPAVSDARGAVSYAELSILTSQFSEELAILGIGPGDRVAILLPNSRGFVAAHFGALATGAVSVPLDAAAEIADLARMIECSQPLIMITDETSNVRIANSGIAELPWLLVLVVEETEGCSRLKSLKPRRIGIDDARAHMFSSRGACDVLMFTNGTSGTPKGVMLHNHNVLSVVRNVESFVGYTRSDVELIALPLSHSFGLGQLYACLATGACACISVDLMFPAKILAEARRLQATGLSCTPATLALLFKFCPHFFPECRAHLRYCVVNSAAVPTQIVDKVSALNPTLRFFHYYGLTEASRTTYICFNDTPGKAASVGRPMPHACVKVMDDSGVGLPCGETGQIAISGEAIFSGYWRDLAGSARVMHGEWFWTGDLGYLDQDGFLFLAGRVGDVINVDGLKFHPAEVEAVLMEIPGVRGAGVVAVPEADEVSGIKLVGVVVLEEGAVLEAHELRSACALRLRSFKVPKVFVKVDTIPQLPTGKMDRKGLRMLAENLSRSRSR
jgi:long-chain acyl-CoA synthetase